MNECTCWIDENNPRCPQHGRDSEFDPRLHVDARELRRAGIAIPENIPDCAWVPRDSIIPTVVPTATNEYLSMYIKLEFRKPFRWWQVSLTIDAASPK